MPGWGIDILIEGRPRTYAFVGTRGVPANYGGFETAAEEIGARLVERGARVIVYSRDKTSTTAFRGMEVRYAPSVHRKSLETLTHASASLFDLKRRREPIDSVLVFNAGNALLIPLFRQLLKARIVIHPDGLEWKRAKWPRPARRAFKWSEGFALAKADGVIADAEALQSYYRWTYGVDSVLAAYGAAGPATTELTSEDARFRPHHYLLIVARFEPENNVLEMVEGYTRSRCNLPLVVVGSAPFSDKYVAQIARIAERDSRIHLLGGVYQAERVDALYYNALGYLHGHSVGGTNPSLLRAMAAGAPVMAHDNPFNREVTDGRARFFTSAQTVREQFDDMDVLDYFRSADRSRIARETQQRYDWDSVTDEYDSILNGQMSCNKR